MKVAVFSTKPHDKEFLDQANKDGQYQFTYFETRLSKLTAPLAEGFPAVCVFVNDDLDGEILLQLFDGQTRMIALRCAGFNNVDLSATDQLGMTVARVPAYSPHSISEYTIGMILSLTRKLHRSFDRTRDGNFSLDGMMGFDLCNKTVGIIGTGKIGSLTAQGLHGLGCRVLAHDLSKNAELEAWGIEYVSRDELFHSSDVISLHCPLLPDTHHLINAQSIEKMKRGVLLINTSRGGLVDTEDVIQALKSEQIGGFGLDVYEEEGDIFYEDYSNRVLQDDILARLLTFPNVVVSGHQAFFTQEAMQSIAETTIQNLAAFARGDQPPGMIHYQMLKQRNAATARKETPVIADTVPF